MANAALVIEWGMTKDGRELKAVEVFMSHMQWWTELKTGGKIENFSSYGLTTGNMTARSGLVVIEGSTEQIDDLRHSEDFRVNLNRVINVVNNVNAQVAETGEAMMSRMQRFGKTVKELG